MSLKINPNVSGLRCSFSGKAVASNGFSSPIGLCQCCPAPGKPVVVEYDRERVRGELAGAPLMKRRGCGIWRYAPLLPVVDVPEAYAADVGGTPTVRHERLSRELGVEVFIKNEGTNPSGSFKDRGLAVGIALGRACGAKRFCLPTQGNAGVAACLFSARLGLPGCMVWMPDGFQGCLYHKGCEFYGGEVRFFGPNIAATGRRMREELQDDLASGAYVDISTFFEPGRLEGKKTMGLEIVEAFTGQPLPDFILYPTGGGTGLVGIWKALSELAALGLLEPEHATRLPRMVSVQSVNCAPVVEAFHKGLAEVAPVSSRGTVADGLDVPSAIMGHGMLQVLRESGGTAVSATEQAIVAAFKRFGACGVNAGYESATTLAGLLVLREAGKIHDGARVLLLATGTQLIALSKGRGATSGVV
jgi:threonine synthase